MFFVCAVIWDLHLLQEVVLLNLFFYIFLRFYIIIWRQRNNWNIKFNIIYLKCCSNCCCCLNKRIRWVSIWISRNFRSSIFFQYYTFFWPLQSKFYFKVNQWQIEKPPKPSALSINVLLIFDTLDLNGALLHLTYWLIFLSSRLFALLSSTVIVLFTTIYASLYSHKQS